MTAMLPLKKVFLRESPATDCYDVIAKVEPGSMWGAPCAPGQVQVLSELALPAVMTLNQGDISPVAFSLSRTAAQALLEGLWEVGLRPEEWRKPGAGPLLGMQGPDLGARVEQLTNQLDSARMAHITDLRRAAGLVKTADQPETRGDELQF